jgi:hypothetical protein
MEMPPSKAPERARELFRLAQFQIEAAAGSLCRQYGYVGATQAGLLSIELASKAALVSAGTDEETLKDKFGHNLLKLAKEVGRVHPAFDVERVTRSLGTMPSYVPNRYSGDQPGRMESGHIVMRAQYIVSEIVRQFGARNFRNECGFDKARSYPE